MESAALRWTWEFIEMAPRSQRRTMYGSLNPPMRGFTLLEFAVGMALSATIAAGVVMSARHAARAAIAINAANQRLDSANRLLSLAEAITSDKQLSAGLTPLPLIHRSGQMRYLDGTAFGGLSPATAADPRSDAISSLRLRSEQLLRVRRYERNGALYKLRVCRLFDGAEPPAAVRSFMALGVDGSYELVTPGCNEITPPRSGCAVMTLTDPGHSLLHAGAPSGALNMLFPIRALRSFYLDRFGRLRQIGHCGERILDNQPVIEGARLFQAANLLISERGIAALELQLLPQRGRPIVVRSIAPLFPVDRLNLLLNLM